MKTTVDIPDTLFRRAKAAAATEGISLKVLISDALERRLRERGGLDAPAWRRLAGELSDLRAERKVIERAIDAEFERVDEEEA